MTGKRAAVAMLAKSIDLRPGTLLKSGAWAGPRKIQSVTGPAITLIALAVQRYETRTLPSDVIELPRDCCPHCGRGDRRD